MRNIIVFIPKDKGREKTMARGFWRDNGKIYYDYVTPQEVSAESIPEAVEALRVKYNQIAMFYIERDNEGDKASAFIQSAEYKTEILPYKISISVKGKSALRAYIKRFLRDYGGVTVYIEDKDLYILESWKK